MRHEVAEPILVNTTEGSLNLPVGFAKMAVPVGRRGQADFSLQGNGGQDGVRYFFPRGLMRLRPFRGIVAHFQVVVSAGSSSWISSNWFTRTSP